MSYIVEIISNLWSLDFCKRFFFLEYCFFGVLIYFGLIMFIELYKFRKLVMHLNSCSMDLGREIYPYHINKITNYEKTNYSPPPYLILKTSK